MTRGGVNFDIVPTALLTPPLLLWSLRQRSASVVASNAARPPATTVLFASPLIENVPQTMPSLPPFADRVNIPPGIPPGLAMVGAIVLPTDAPLVPSANQPVSPEAALSYLYPLTTSSSPQTYTS